MNIASTFFEGWKKIFTGSNIGVKHLCLFVLTGIISSFTTRFNLISDAAKALNVLPDMSGMGWGLLLAFVIGIFLMGYGFIFMHNCYGENPENLLPDFSWEAFKVFWKSLPLIIVWALYVLIAGVVGISLLITPFMTILGVIIFALLGFTCVFIQFIYAIYCENYDKKGLFNILMPFKCIRYSLGETIMLGLLAIAAYILAFIPLVLLIIIFSLAGIRGDEISYISGIIGGYFAFVMQFVWNYCLVKIYIEKIKPKLQ